MSKTESKHSPPPPRANPDLIGHQWAEQRFLTAWRSGRLPHAWLICGPPGIGKATFAFRAARFALSGGSRPAAGRRLACSTRRRARQPRAFARSSGVPPRRVGRPCRPDDAGACRCASDSDIEEDARDRSTRRGGTPDGRAKARGCRAAALRCPKSSRLPTSGRRAAGRTRHRRRKAKVALPIPGGGPQIAQACGQPARAPSGQKPLLGPLMADDWDRPAAAAGCAWIRSCSS